MTTPSYLVATTGGWNVEAFHRHVSQLPGNWHLVAAKEELTPELITRIAPRYIFFPHWSWRIGAPIREAAECIIFHMTDVPYGRGGSPLQNLIVRGHTDTVLSALRAVEELDAGPVYLKKPMSLAGTAQEIYRRAADLVFQMVAEIVATQPQPVPQQGQPVFFRRRTPQESVLPDASDMLALFNHIRMLDAAGYPLAFIEHGSWRVELSNATIEDGTLCATARFRVRGG